MRVCSIYLGTAGNNIGVYNGNLVSCYKRLVKLQYWQLGAIYSVRKGADLYVK